ncbi:histidine--tRNA ligase [Theileria orientalis]|uniref:histidine--tRNA ligase n=1 Tax=Theileria orientalis TaxID=68886 RepID=A0A976MEQ6_THEOR|nr:histidine--tRNA ligase [Theileria orientalis]
MIFNLSSSRNTLLIFVFILNSYTFSFQVRSQTHAHKFGLNDLYSHIDGLRALNKSNIETVRGAQCYLPAEQRIQRWIQDKWEEASKKFGFQEYSMPVLTHTSVFENATTRISDEHFKEMYSFRDKKGRNLSLRADITPQFMNMLKSLRTKGSTLPSSTLKWYTIADCWRYERPSYCRRRNHLQWNVDVIGISSLDVELDILSLLIYFFKSVGITERDVKISINHRDFTLELLKHLGIKNYSQEWFYKFSKILDKYKKTPKNELNTMLNELNISPSQCKDLHRVLESSKTLKDLEKFIKSESLVQLRNLIKGLRDRGYLNWIDIDLTIVRGNEYYTGIVFECFDTENKLPRSLAGGGRYDNYFDDSDPVLSYSAGFGMGNIALTNLLKQKNLMPEPPSLVDVLVFLEIVNVSSSDNKGGDVEQEHTQRIGEQSIANVNEPVGDINSENIGDNSTEKKRILEQKRCLYNLMEILRHNDLSVYHYYKTPKVKRALRFAEKWTVPFVLMPITLNGTPMVMLKNLHLRTHEYFNIDDPSLYERVLTRIKKLIVK